MLVYCFLIKIFANLWKKNICYRERDAFLMKHVRDALCHYNARHQVRTRLSAFFIRLSEITSCYAHAGWRV